MQQFVQFRGGKASIERINYGIKIFYRVEIKWYKSFHFPGT